MARFRTALGLMSGTSMDGVDVALLTTDGDAIGAFGPARTYPYAAADRQCLRDAVAAARDLHDRNDRPPAVERAERLVTHRHAEVVAAFLAETETPLAAIDVIGFHGQTVLHDPARRLTVQLGDGRALAESLGRPVVFDLRAADVAAGGQGAPLVPVFHRAMAARAGLTPPLALLNIGGVANVTFIAADGDLLAFDTGPGNALIDDWVSRLAGASFDRDGALARSGAAGAEAPLRNVLADPYFGRRPPKSLDRDHFSARLADGLGAADGARLLTAFTAEAVARAAEHFPHPPRRWIVCGGGRRNGYLMSRLRTRLGQPVQAAEEVGLDGDATEAQAFAYLAVRAADGKPISFPGTTGAPHPMTGGIVAVPARPT